MSEDQDPPLDESQEDAVSDEEQDQRATEAEGEGQGEPESDDSPELRLQALAAEYARERAVLAEQISQLQEENDHLRQRVGELEQSDAPRQAEITALLEDDRHPERALGLDFSLPEEQDKG